VEVFEALLEMEQKGLTHARPLPQQKTLGRMWQGIGFFLANLSFVVPLAEIKEILSVLPETPLPVSVSWFRGVANLRGHLLPVTDLQGFLLTVPHITTALSRVLVINFDQTHAGFVVQEVVGIQRFLETDLVQGTLEGIDERLMPYVPGTFLQNGKKWHILSLKTLSQNSQFCRVINEIRG
jgi:twitching motility protein PilI